VGSQGKGTGFEGVYQALKDGATNPTDTAVFKEFHAMVAGMFHSMRYGFEHVSLGGSAQRFLASFDAIFTLNQDTLIELQYIGGLIQQLSGGRFFDCEAPGLVATAGNVNPPGLFQPRDPPYTITERHQPYFKLHGSSNWVLPDRSDLMLIIGGNKATSIDSSPLLSWYRQEFRRMLDGARVVIIGYSFQDGHINEDPIHAASTGARFFLIDPYGVDIIDKRKSAAIKQPKEPLMEALMNNIDGASRRSLIRTFDHDQIEMQKLQHFITASSRRSSNPYTGA